MLTAASAGLQPSPVTPWSLPRGGHQASSTDEEPAAQRGEMSHGGEARAQGWQGRGRVLLGLPRAAVLASTPCRACLPSAITVTQEGPCWSRGGSCQSRTGQ